MSQLLGTERQTVRPMPAVRRQVNGIIVCLLIALLTTVFAYNVEHGFGRASVQLVRFMHPSGEVMVGKLYRPLNATADNKKPGVLAIHGFQNDKDTQDAFAIELSRRGFVVLAIDALGHGSSGGGLFTDPSMGGNAGYAYLKSLPFVDSANLGVMGHSMGAGATIAVGMANPDHKALNPQCGNAGGPDLHNVLLTQAKYEEFRGFRENQGRTEGLVTNADRLKGFGLTGEAKWDTTYGSFAEGTARRQTLVSTVHPGVTHNSKAVTETVEWMRQALKAGQKDDDWIPAESHIYMLKEWATLIALLATLLSIIPLANILLSRPFFAEVAQPLPARYTAGPGAWWGFAVVNVLIAGVTYPILTPIGMMIGLQIPWLHVPMANGLVVWFLVNALIAFVPFRIWYHKAHKKGVTMYDMGYSFDENKTRLNWRIIGKTALLGALLFAWMYVVEGIAEWGFGVEFRFLWGFMRQFTPRRFVYFLMYCLPVLAFYLMNGGVLLFGQARQKAYRSPVRTQLVWWLKNSLFFVGGLVLVCALQYLPYVFLGLPPGFEIIGLPILGEMWPLMTLIFIPEFLPLLFIMTWAYRRTGKIYLGAMLITTITMWFMCAGSVLS